MSKRSFPYFPNLERDCSWESPVDEDGVQVSSHLDEMGREVPDPTPMSPPIGMTSGPSLADFVHRMIKNEVSRAAAAAEMETFDEADDFDIEDDPTDPLTPYEKHFVPEQPPLHWPMYYNPSNGLYGQLPPNERVPDGFVPLRKQTKGPPEGYELVPEPPPQGGGGTKSPSGQPTGEAPIASPAPGKPLT